MGLKFGAVMSQSNQWAIEKVIESAMINNVAEDIGTRNLHRVCMSAMECRSMALKDCDGPLGMS
jgi:hypothetical protein